MIVAGSIVGSGELIATTKVGAEAGFVLLWLILVGCVIKVFTQVELGRAAVVRGATALQTLDELPGPRWRAGWAVWLWGLMTLLTLAQQGGIIGGVGQALSMTMPLTEAGAQFHRLQEELVALEVQSALDGAAAISAGLAARMGELRGSIDQVGPVHDSAIWATALAIRGEAVTLVGPLLILNNKYLLTSGFPYPIVLTSLTQAATVVFAVAAGLSGKLQVSQLRKRHGRRVVYPFFVASHTEQHK